MHQYLIAAALMLPVVSAQAQTGTSKCVTVTLFLPMASGIPALIGNPTCFDKAAISASSGHIPWLTKTKPFSTTKAGTLPLALVIDVASVPVPALMIKGVERQVNLSGFEYGGRGGTLGKDYILPSKATLAYFKAKGIHTIRLPARWERLQPKIGGPLDKAKLMELDGFLARADMAGVRVIFDLHNFGKYDNVPLGTAKLPVEALAQFYAPFAKRYRGRFAGYDLMNEPNGLPNGGAWPAAAQAATNAVAVADPTTDVYVEGDGWSGCANWQSSNGTWLNVKHPVNQRRVVYSCHTYWDRDRSGTHYGTAAEEGADKYRGAWQLGFMTNWCRKRGARCHVGEFGAPADVSWLPVMATFLKAADEATDVLTGVTYWSAGEWISDPQSIQPKDGTDKPQVGWMMQRP